MFFAVKWGDVLLVTAGAVAASVGTIIHAIVTNRHARTMEHNRRKREADAEFVDICSAFLTQATSVVRKAIRRAEEQQSVWDDASAEFDKAYAPGNKLRLIAPPPVASATEAVLDAVESVQYHWDRDPRELVEEVRPEGNRNLAWEQFNGARQKLRDAAEEQFAQSFQK